MSASPYRDRSLRARVQSAVVCRPTRGEVSRLRAPSLLARFGACQAGRDLTVSSRAPQRRWSLPPPSFLRVARTSGEEVRTVTVLRIELSALAWLAAPRDDLRVPGSSA